MPKTSGPKGPGSKGNGRSTRSRPTDDELLDAALSVIAEVGADRATMDMIALRGETSRVTLYAHFGSRDALVDAVIDRELTALTAWKTAAYDKGDQMSYGAHIRYSVESLFEYARRHPEGFRVLLKNRDELGDTGRRLSTALAPKVAERLRAAFATRGQRMEESVEILASMLVGLTLDVAYRAVIVSGADIDASCALAVTSAMAVLRTVDVQQLHAIDKSLARN